MGKAEISETQAHYFGSRAQKNCSRSACAVGKGKAREEEAARSDPKRRKSEIDQY